MGTDVQCCHSMAGPSPVECSSAGREGKGIPAPGQVVVGEVSRSIINSSLCLQDCYPI